MKKKILICVMALTAVFTLSGCGEKKESNNSSNGSNENTTTTKASKGNCNVVDCMKQIKPENTIEEINNIIGFEGELLDEKYNKTEWKLNDTDSITVIYYQKDKGSISSELDKKAVANDDIKFDKYSEIKDSLNDGSSLTYDQFVEKVNNVQGVLIENSSSSKTYLWSKSDGRYLKASFSNNSGKCTFVTGRL